MKDLTKEGKTSNLDMPLEFPDQFKLKLVPSTSQKVKTIQSAANVSRASTNSLLSLERQESEHDVAQ